MNNSPKVSVIIPVYNVERYIKEMLLSVQKQTFKDFEVILVNDGSPDNSQNIIDEFCCKDKRFKSVKQENGGVASARNNGLSRAKGEYVVFYDPDDFIPPKALASMYSSVKKENADICVGVMRERRTGECRYNASTIRLGKKAMISKFDKDLLWSFSVCNKIFRREMIVDNGFIFPSFKHAEDAVFLFQCIFAAQKIVGCKQCVYEYKFRPFWESKSGTQMMKVAYLKDVIGALDTIEQHIIKNIADDNNSTQIKKDFLDEFYARYLDISLFVGYYRQLWMTEQGCLKTIHEKVIDIKGKISPEKWTVILNKNKDLQLYKEIYTEEDALANALLSFVVFPGIPEEKVQIVLNSIYDQAMPSFKVIMDQSYEPLVRNLGFLKSNMIFKTEVCLEDIDTDFVMTANEDVLYSKNSIRIMINAMLNDESIDFTTAPLKKYNGENLVDTQQSAAFTTLQCIKGNSSVYNSLDDYLGNKLLRNRIANKLWAKDGMFEYDSLRFKKIYNAHMILGKDEEKTKDSNRVPNSFRTKIKCKQKSAEDRIIEFIKKSYTKDDVKKIKRMLGK